MAKKLNQQDLLKLTSIDTPPTDSVAFAAKSDGLYQKIGSVESKLSTTAELLDRVKTAVPANAKFTDTNTTYGAVTTSANGLMIAADKVKLNGIATRANNYVHPSAHPISFITGLQSALDGKSATSHTHTFASLTNKPTTLSGFGITDVYTKAEVNSLANYVGRYSSANGFLVKTDVARTENSMLVLHIKGNSYGGAVPINTFVQVYNYVTNDAIINTGALNNGYKINEVKAFYYNNLVYFWVPQQTGYMTMTFQLLKAEGQVNRVDSVTNAAVPTSGVEKMVTITPRTAWFENTLTKVSQLSNDSGYITASASITGNAATATKLATSRTINGTSFNGSANITTANWGTARNIGVVNSDGTGTAVTTSVNGSANVNLKLPSTIKATLTGNASSATKIQTARTIAGVSFDGSANIAIPFANLSGIPSTFAPTSHTHVWTDITNRPTSLTSFTNNLTNFQNNIEIGTASVHKTLRVFGNLTATNAFKDSDICLKTNIKDINNSLIDKVNLIEFDWKKDGKRDYGVIAQEVEKYYPELVNTDEDGMKQVNYESLYAIKISRLEDRIKELEEKLCQK